MILWYLIREYFKNFYKCEVKDIFELYTIMFNVVLIHEIRHAVFEYTAFKEIGIE